MSSLEIEKLGPYRLQEVIGNGGMAKVYRATQEGDHGFSKPVALKLLKPQLAADPDAVDAFISEARLGSLLSHPHIVAVLNFGQLEQYYFLAMELMEGPTLFEVLTCHQRLQRRIPPAIVFQLIRQVCEGLSFAHQAMDRTGQPLNVIHRDLKPSNVLLSWHGVAKLGDFGVARAESNLLHTRVGGVAKGTAQYMAPEQAWGELELTPRTDCAGVEAAAPAPLAASVPSKEPPSHVTLSPRSSASREHRWAA
ncbi:MAG: serine/threonine-protein kinase [Myxococcota bacterium]